MSHATARLRTVRRFHESAGAKPARAHQLAIYDNGTVRLLLDRSEGEPPRLLASLKRDDALGPGDQAPQVKAICDEYVRQYLRDGGPLACRLTRADLTGESREISPQGAFGPAAPARTACARPERRPLAPPNLAPAQRRVIEATPTHEEKNTMLLINGRGCHRISRERASGRLIATITGGAAAGSLHLRQDEQYTWSVYSEPTDSHIPLAPTELLDELLAAECEFRANELIGFEHRPRAHPALANDLVRRASQARVAALEREQRRRRAGRNSRRVAGGER